MKHIITLFFLTISTTLLAQKLDYNTEKGTVAKGYDIVAYFSNKVVEGSKKITFKHNNVNFRFSNKENLNKFKENPNKYIPQYGGYCAYALGKKGKKIDINPETFEIRNGKLYLFYNSWGSNTLNLWKQENTEKLKKQADINWQKLNH
ncbi:YHS domain-containing (seleno)protein [Tenacibaculum pacificus]|uniref:YHS domain-containing (seleno)protein n=1 Tax=Tenacibaculum TaxID=104267 RepID=UPI0022F3DE74|nr:YHS domain-containing (seleno)protein [Tenacibaculum pacificus]WBX73675.1 YHS domain-containing (seleno)protein [Tenacibaculum pacificus]